MASVNKVILVGNLGADPETKYLPSGDAVTNIRLATTDRWKDKASGEMKEATEWHRIAFFGRLAEVAGEYLKKGSQVYVEGRIRTRKWRTRKARIAIPRRSSPTPCKCSARARAPARRVPSRSAAPSPPRKPRPRRRRRPANSLTRRTTSRSLTPLSPNNQRYKRRPCTSTST